MDSLSLQHFKPHHFTAMEQADTFLDLFSVADDIIAHMPKGDIIQICGSISTGILPKEQNILIFERTIETFYHHDFLVFNQMPFGAEMGKIAKRWHAENPDKSYCKPILDEFYYRIFKTGKIKRFVFIPLWRHSFGATWEYYQAPQHGILRSFLPPDWVNGYDLSRWRL